MTHTPDPETLAKQRYAILSMTRLLATANAHAIWSALHTSSTARRHAVIIVGVFPRDSQIHQQA